jgi:hypothetical protein
VQVRRLISKRIRRVGNGVDLVADLNADVSVNVRSSPGTRAAAPTPKSRPGADPKRKGKETR